MQPSASELEQIVRVVMQRLAAGNDLMAGVTEMAEATVEPTELAISDRVVTTSVIESRLDGKRTVRVASHAIVTPAVTDLLRGKKIDLIRDTQTVAGQRSSKTSRPLVALATKQASLANGSHAVSAAPTTELKKALSIGPNSAPILVCGSAVWFNSLFRHLCPKQTVVETCDDSAALLAVERHLAHGGQRAVWLSSTPFAAAASAQRGTSAVTVQLPSLAELPAALAQAQPQVLVVDAPRWTVAAIGNLVRSLARI